MVTALLVIFGSISIVFAIGALTLVNNGNLITFVFTTGLLGFLVTFLNRLYFQNKYSVTFRIKKICEIIIKIAAINFLAYIIGYIAIGGSVISRDIENGIYIIGSHGYNKEVSATIFYYSLIHTGSMIITYLLAMLASWIQAMTGGRRKLVIKPEIFKKLPKKQI